MKNKLVLAVGNGLMGDDGAAVLLAQMLNETPLADWEILNGGSTPENVVHQVRDLAVEQVLVVDAADMDLPAGAIRLIQENRLEDPFLLTTHTLPLTYLIQALREFVPQVRMVGIQPDVVAFGYPMSPAVKQAVVQVYADLREGNINWETL